MDYHDYPPSLLDYALRILGRRRYSTAEMNKKLNQKSARLKIAINEQQIQAVLGRLIDLKLLNDQEFAALFIEDQLRRKPQGLMLIKQSLSKKGLDPDIVNKILEQKNIDEKAQAKSAAAKKLGTLARYSKDQKKQKLFRHLSSRGFTAENIFNTFAQFHLE